MPTRPSTPVFGQSLNGGAPGDWADTAAVDGDRPPWSRAPLGSTYWRRVTSNQQELVLKVKDDGRNDDWVVVQGVICQFLELADFTDGESTAGTCAINGTIPAGAHVPGYHLINITDFVGSSQVDFDLGTAADPDRYNGTTAPRLDATAVMLAQTVPSGLQYHATAVTDLTATVTDDSDFGDITSGSLTIVLFYYGGVVA